MDAGNLDWLHSGLYRLLYGTSLSTAVLAAEGVLAKVCIPPNCAATLALPSAPQTVCSPQVWNALLLCTMLCVAGSVSEKC